MRFKVSTPIIASAVALAGVAATSAVVSRKAESQPAPTPTATATASPSANVTPVNEGFKIDNVRANVKGQSGLMEIVGEIQNNTGADTLAVTLIGTFYDKKGQIVGTASGVVNGLKAGEKRTFGVLTADIISDYAEVKVQVDTVLK